MNIITPGMRKFADKAADKAAQKTPEELKKQAEEVGIGDNSIRAKYKIEVTYGQDRTTMGPNVCGIQIWESGRRLNGGGDDLAFWCLSTDNKTHDGCGGVILSDNIKAGVALCPWCKRAINADMLVNMKVGKFSTQTLSKELEKMFRDLNSNADLYLKYHRADIRTQAMERAKGPEVARRLKGMHIYPLKNILRDTQAGASVQGRFFAFLTS